MLCFWDVAACSVGLAASGIEVENQSAFDNDKPEINCTFVF
jgi:hypothetical protein